ncbi:MAG TPA: hypothetical protein ENK62_01900 [Chromatiales bacterium]|nr:hypothetical protein [Chromatiales bacterium]
MDTRIVGYVHQGLTSETIDLIIEEEDWSPTTRAWTRTVYGTAPTRVVAHLTPVDGGDEVVLDSQTLGLGSGQPFEWDSAQSRLLLRWGGLVPNPLPTGTYWAALDWYDSAHPGGVRLGRPQRLMVVVEG